MPNTTPNSATGSELPDPRPPAARKLALRTLSFALPACLALGLFVHLLHEAERRHNAELLAATEALKLDTHARRVEEYLAHSARSLLLIARQPEAATLLATGDDAALSSLMGLMAETCQQSGLFDQVRIIHAAGPEMARVDKTPAGCRGASFADLQDKAGRYYLEAALALPEGGVYISPMDLNVENGAVEVPHKPTVRLATPVYEPGAGPGARPLGIAIINYLAADTLEGLADSDAGAPGFTRLLNREGFYLRAPDPADAWGFQLGDSAEAGPRFQDRHPALWERMAGTDAGQFMAPEGLVTHRLLRPTRMVHRHTHAGESSGPRAVSPDQWRLVSVVSPAALTAGAAPVSGYLGLAAFLGLMTLAASYVLARSLMQRQALTEALAARNRRLEEGRRLAEAANEAKSQFLTNVGHELRTPLHGVQGMLEALKGSGLDEEQRDYVETSLASSRNLLRVVNDLLDLSRMERGALSVEEAPFDPTLCLMNVKDSLAMAAYDKGLDLRMEADPDLPLEVLGDEGRLAQVLTNLCGNAIKFTRQGAVTVGLQRLPLAPAGKVCLLFTVTDTGQGIAETDQERIFNPFTQASADLARQHQGVGLGLSISRRLVELMPASLCLESTPGLGSVFYLVCRFPLPTGDAPAP